MPTLPKSREEVHSALDGMDIKTNRDELFLLCNDSTKGLVIFSSKKNLECLCSATDIFIDGTFKCCAKFFLQLYSIHGLLNGHYVPLVFTLLCDKSQTTYKFNACGMPLSPYVSQGATKFTVI